MYICTLPVVCSVPAEARSCHNVLDLEWQVAVSCHVGPGNRNLAFCESIKCSQTLSRRSSS